MKITHINIFILIILVFSSCSLKKDKQEQEKAIARVYDRYLYPSDIIGINSTKLSEIDSIEFIKAYTGSWIKNQLLLYKAESNLTEEDLDIDKLIENYRESLVIFTYEQKVIEQTLDTIVTEIEIENYYENNKSNFELRQNIVKVSYLITKSKVVKKPAEIKKWLMSDNEDDQYKLQKFCEANAEKYYFDENKWFLFSDIIKEIPIDTYNEEAFLKTNNYINFKDSDYEYFIYIKDFMAKESISPLEFVKSNINNIIINKRKKMLLQQIENDLYKTALKNNAIDIY
ncbi:MAG: hypothetical protein LBP67_03665 [Bacteroidales bacterium]|jgi:hypothetical protein|nr:hypothetical protein [Bacteroidales bacterium]